MTRGPTNDGVDVGVVNLAELLLVALAGTWIALLLHELGHTAAASLLGVRVWGIRLGLGPTIWCGRVGECRVHLALFPFLGAVQLVDEDACAIGYRDIVAGSWRFEWVPGAWRAPIISAAGGLSNLAGLTVLLMLWDWIGRPALGTVTGDLLLFALASNLAGYLNLLPCFRSDGIHLLAHLRAVRFRIQGVD
jgi:hypothetical protein